MLQYEGKVVTCYLLIVPEGIEIARTGYLLAIAKHF